MRILRLAPAALALLLLLPAPGGGTPPFRIPVTEGEFFSDNGAFVLVADAKAERYTVYAVADRKAPLWGFSREPGSGTFLVADDGETVADLIVPRSDFRHFGGWPVDSMCLQVRGRDGIRKAYRLSELCASTHGIGSSGALFSRWHDWFSSAWPEGDAFRVRTIDGTEFAFSFRSGEVLEQEPVWQIWLRRVTTAYLAVWGTCVLLAAAVTVFALWRLTARRRRRAAGGEPAGTGLPTI
jgi:hypothetical protein